MQEKTNKNKKDTNMLLNVLEEVRSRMDSLVFEGGVSEFTSELYVDYFICCSIENVCCLDYGRAITINKYLLSERPRIGLHEEFIDNCYYDLEKDSWWQTDLRREKINKPIDEQYNDCIVLKKKFLDKIIKNLRDEC